MSVVNKFVCKTKGLMTSAQLPIQHDTFLSKSTHACPHLGSPSTPQNTPKPHFNHPITFHPTITPTYAHSSCPPNYRLNADNILANAVICAFCTTFLTPSVLSPSSFPCPVRSEVLVDISLRYMGDVDFCASLAGRSRSEIVSNFGSFGFLGGRGFRLGGEPPTRGN